MAGGCGQCGRSQLVGLMLIMRERICIVKSELDNFVPVPLVY